MSSLDDHCIITKYDLTEKEKQLKKAFFNPAKRGETAKNLKKDTHINNNFPNENVKGAAVPDEFLNKLIKENVDPLVNQSLKYLSNNQNAAGLGAGLPLNIVYNQNRILERNVDILQETQRSLKDFFVYNLQQSDKKRSSGNHAKSDSFETKKFLLEIIKPLYQNIEGIKSQINNLNNPNINNINSNKNNPENAGNKKDEIYLMQKNLKNSTSKVENSLNLVELNAAQGKKDNELYKLIEEIKGSITGVHKEMSKLETDVSENFKKIYEETQKKNLMEMLSVKNAVKSKISNINNGKNDFSKFNFNNNNNSNAEEDSIDYGEFKKSLCDINLRTQEIKNEYENSKAKINFVHKFEKADKIEFSYDIDFKDPFGFNSFTTNDDSMIAKEIKAKSKSINKNFATAKSKNLKIVNKLNKNKQKDFEDNYDTTDHEIFHKNKNDKDKKNNVFLDNLNKSLDSKLNVANKAENSEAKKQNANQSTNYTLNSPSGVHNNTNSLIKSINNNNANSKNPINIISEEATEETILVKNNKNNQFIENAKSEFENKKNQKSLKDILMQKPNLEDYKNTSKQKLLKDLVTKLLIEKIIVDKNKKATKAGLVSAPATNEELNFFLREKEFSGKHGTGKYLDLDLDEKNAREITEKCVKERIRTLLNKKKIRNLVTGVEKNNAFDNQKSLNNKNIDEFKDEENADIIKSLENKLFDKLNKENCERDNFLNENFKTVLQRLNEMEKNMGGSVAINSNDDRVRKRNVLNGLENENNVEKLSESQYIEIDKSSKNNRKTNNYDEMIDIITEKIKSNMHITINLNSDGKNLSTNNNLNENDNKNKISTDNQKELKENIKKNNENPTMGYTHPFADRNKILKLLDNSNYFQNKANFMQNIPLPHTINLNDFEVSSESCLTDSKRSEINQNLNNNNNYTKNTNQNLNNYYSGTNQNLLFYTNMDNKIPNFQVTGKYAEDRLGYINSLKLDSIKNNTNNDLSNEKHLLNANILAAELNRQKHFDTLGKINSRDESLSEGQVQTLAGVTNDSELESVYAQSHTIADAEELDELNNKILRNKQKLEALDKKDLNIVKNRELNLNDLKNINKDLEDTLEKYDNNFNNNKLSNKNNLDFNDTGNDDYEESSSNRYNISNSNQNNENYADFHDARKMDFEELNQQNLQENPKDLFNKNEKKNLDNDCNQKTNNDLNSEAKMEEKIKFLKANNLYDSEEQANFQKTFHNVLRKNNILSGNSNNTSQASNFNNILSSFNNNNNNLSGSLASSGKLRLGSARHTFLSGNNNNNNNNHVFQSFGGNILNSNNQNSNRTNTNSYNIINNPNLQQQMQKNFAGGLISNSNNNNLINSQESNISSNVNSGREPNESLNSSNQIHIYNSNNFHIPNNKNNDHHINMNEKYYYGYNNTISENYTESNNESALDRGVDSNRISDNNYKFYKTDESSLDLHN